MSLIAMDFDFTKLGELAQYRSLITTRSYCGVGAFELRADPRAVNATEFTEGRIAFLSESPSQAYIIDELTLSRTELIAKGTMLKGIAARRVCVPPLNLPLRLWRYASGAWAEITDSAAIRAAITDGSVYQGFAKPVAPSEGMLFLDMTELGSVYDWGSGMGLGEVVSDVGEARLRSKYQNFGWDRFTGSAEAAYLHYAQTNLIAPESAERTIPNLVAAENQGRGDALPWQARFDKLDALFERIGEATGLGWDITPDYINRRFVFRAVQGRDLSAGGTVALISEKLGNASCVTLKRSLTGSATTAYVGGAGEDENRFILCVGGVSEGLERREMWTEAGSISDAELMTLYGRDKLTAARAKESMTATLIDSGACRAGRDYDVGDKVLVRDSYGNEMAARVASITETREGGRKTISASFGDAPVSLGAAMRRGVAAAR